MTRTKFSVPLADGLLVPVVDVTHPDFMIDAVDDDIDVMVQQFVGGATARGDVSPAVREALQQSVLGQGLFNRSGTFLSGIATYLLKLGPANLGSWATPLDQQIAAAVPAFMARLRLQDTARLLADAVREILGRVGPRPIHFINIGGGTAADSWNALLLLNADAPELLAGSPLRISILDIDTEGPAFGAAAVAALARTSGPLEGLDVSVARVSYNWSDVSSLAEHLDISRDNGAVQAISSEGALFEYGTDDEIAANLEAMHRHSAGNIFVVGTVTRDDEASRAVRLGTGLATQPRTFAAFRSLCDQSGWRVDRVIERPFSYNVLLVKRTH